ncbi:inositol monophosphatase [Candidatus Saccharibacteria bacterium]|nr:inositol monophosphatase [Candidatus Saccharibacteria bacterium]NCU40281.1 inositol monophosphatase [Candidatus Saccharibacteria bacterium]
MIEQQNKDYLEFAKVVAYEAGEIMREYYYKKNIKNHYKKPTNDAVEVVTEADEKINRWVIERVKQRFPDHGVYGEEESYNRDSEYVWVCDPIDGTNPFIMGLMVSVFSLALTRNGVPEVGVIYDFHGNKLYESMVGGGAFMNGKQIHVNNLGLEPKARFNADWWVGAGYDPVPVIHQLALDTGMYVLTIGSIAHACALVAKGEFVASLFPGTEGKNVDVAAAKVIIEEAGGKVTDIFGKEQRYDRPIEGAILSNGIVHNEIVERLMVLREEKRL